ncbi:MAG: nucleoside hydrolase, partial [Pseudohongiellaceae bacterium]
MIPVIFDNDIGIDDAMALLLLDASSEVNLLGITTRFGNASIETTTRNALIVRDLFDIQAPVFKGAGEPIGLRLGEGYPVHVHGKNGLGDIPLPAPHSQPEAVPAAQERLQALALTDGMKWTPAGWDSGSLLHETVPDDN